MSEREINDPENDLLKKSLSGDLPQTYANGFQVVAGQSDVIVILQRNGKDVEVINLSFTVAKTLAQGLNKIVQLIESKTGMDIKTTHDIAKSLEETDAKSSH